MSDTTTDNGAIITEHGEIIAEGMQIAEFNPDSVVDNYIFEYRINCKEGKAFLGASKSQSRMISNENELGRQELIFTFVAFQKINPSSENAMLSLDYKQVREWGQLIGIDKNGIVFSSFIKRYALGSVQSLIEGFIFDVQMKKETGSLVGKLVKLDFGEIQKVEKGECFKPSFLFLKDESPFKDKAKNLVALRKEGKFSFPAPSLIKI